MSWGSAPQKNEPASDLNRSFGVTWAKILEEDWTVRGKGLGVPAKKGVTVGLSKGDDKFLVQIFDEQQKIGGYSGQAPPPIWAESFSVEQLQELGRKGDTTLHTEGIVSAEWIANQDKTMVTGIRLIVRLPQYPDQPYQTTVQFEPNGSGNPPLKHVLTTVESAEPPVASIPFDDAQKKASVIQEQHQQDVVSFPKNEEELLAKLIAHKPPKVLESITDFEGAATLKVRLDDETNEACASCHGCDGKDGKDIWTQQKVVSCKIIVTNNAAGTDKAPPAISDFYMEFKNASGGWQRFANYDPYNEKKIRGTTVASGGRFGYSDSDASVIALHKDQRFCEFYLEGRHFMEDVVPYAHENKERLHHKFLELAGASETGVVRCRITLADDDQEKKTAEFSVKNPKLEPGFSSFEEVVEHKSNDFNSNHTCLAFLTADNPVTLQKHYHIFALQKSTENKPEYWELVQSKDSRTMERSVSYIYPSTLRRACFMAAKKHRAESEAPFERFDLSDYCTNECKVVAEVENEKVYALTLSIHLQDASGKKTLSKISKTIALDYDALQHGDKVPKTTKPYSPMSW